MIDIVSAPLSRLTGIRPSELQPGRQADSALDTLVEECFAIDFDTFRKALPEAYYLDRVGSAISYRIPWLWQFREKFSTQNALELGCGRGIKALSFSRLFRRYFGVDLNADDIAFAKVRAAEAGRDNLEFTTANAADVVRNPAAYGIEGQIDCIILYAVVEHLTLDERREVLGMCREVMEQGGTVIVCETPNRLIAHDGHSTRLQFFQMLPPDLAIAYSSHSPRSGACEDIGGTEVGLFRFGVGASYHEFDLWMRPDGVFPGVVTDGWNPWIIADEAVRNDECALLAYSNDNDLDMSALFCRYWLDGIFVGDSGKARPATHQSLLLPESRPGVTWLSEKRFYGMSLQSVMGSDSCLAFETANALELSISLEAAGSAGRFSVETIDGAVLAEVDLDAARELVFPKYHEKMLFDLSHFADHEHLVLRPADNSSYLATSGMHATLKIDQ